MQPFNKMRHRRFAEFLEELDGWQGHYHQLKDDVHLSRYAIQVAEILGQASRALHRIHCDRFPILGLTRPMSDTNASLPSTTTGPDELPH